MSVVERVLVNCLRSSVIFDAIRLTAYQVIPLHPGVCLYRALAIFEAELTGMCRLRRVDGISDMLSKCHLMEES